MGVFSVPIELKNRQPLLPLCRNESGVACYG